MNKNIQEKLRDEVLQVRAKYDDKKSYECYQGMTYMEQVILGKSFSFFIRLGQDYKAENYSLSFQLTFIIFKNKNSTLALSFN